MYATAEQGFATAADACGVSAALGIDIATGDDDFRTISVFSATDACSTYYLVFVTIRIDLSASHCQLTREINVYSIISCVMTSADTSTVTSSPCFHCTSVDGHCSAVAVSSATDTSTTIDTSMSYNSATIDSDVTAINIWFVFY